jgi:hypothetical protein
MNDTHDQAGAGWSTMATETFKFNVVPWAGRAYAEWVRAWSRPHPGDPIGLVQLPIPIYQAFQQRAPGQRLSRKDAERLGFPRVPGEQELARVQHELHEALLRGDWDEAHDLDLQLRELQERVALMRLTALKPRHVGA